MKYFDVERADNCIWLIDKRAENRPIEIHFTVGQALEVATELVRVVENPNVNKEK